MSKAKSKASPAPAKKRAEKPATAEATANVDYRKDGPHWQPAAEKLVQLEASFAKGKLPGHIFNSAVAVAREKFDAGQRNEHLFKSIMDITCP